MIYTKSITYLLDINRFKRKQTLVRYQTPAFFLMINSGLMLPKREIGQQGTARKLAQQRI